MGIISKTHAGLYPGILVGRLIRIFAGKSRVPSLPAVPAVWASSRNHGPPPLTWKAAERWISPSHWRLAEKCCWKGRGRDWFWGGVDEIDERERERVVVKKRLNDRK